MSANKLLLGTVIAACAGMSTQGVTAPVTGSTNVTPVQVVETAIYESMFKMLEADRFQYFPRGVGEIRAEEERNAGLGLEIEPTLALHYPVQTYFFVSRKNPRLHDLLEQGLHAAQRDGSFEKLFEQFNGEALRKAKLESRHVFELKVPQ